MGNRRSKLILRMLCLCLFLCLFPFAHHTRVDDRSVFGIQCAVVCCVLKASSQSSFLGWCSGEQFGLGKGQIKEGQISRRTPRGIQALPWLFFCHYASPSLCLAAARPSNIVLQHFGSVVCSSIVSVAVAPILFHPCFLGPKWRLLRPISR